MGSKAKSLKLLFDAGFNVPKLEQFPSEEITKERIEQVVSERMPTTKFFAVRSSADVEDGENKSFAGHFYSEIGV